MKTELLGGPTVRCFNPPPFHGNTANQPGNGTVLFYTAVAVVTESTIP
jgi:hypothetical protein